MSKVDLLDQLKMIDEDSESKARVLRLETEFRKRIDIHLDALPLNNAELKRFNTSPFVLLFQSARQRYTKISQIEGDILPAKLFSSMETSAGKMVELVMLPEYGWQCVESEMHTANSALDGKRVDGDVLKLVTLKSGPKCLNDEMSENFADAIISNAVTWAAESELRKIDFTYGVLYGTKKLSNKKDWHILRKICEKIPKKVTQTPVGRWDCAFSIDGVDVTVTIRIGGSWWTFLGGAQCVVEMCTALIRACVRPGEKNPANHQHLIADLTEIVSTECVPAGFNVSLLQESQIPWLFFSARHFCDELSAT